MKGSIGYAELHGRQVRTQALEILMFYNEGALDSSCLALGALRIVLQVKSGYSRAIRA